jgi:hypothetical protein
MKFDDHHAALLRPVKFSLTTQQSQHLLSYLNKVYIDFLSSKSWLSFTNSVDILSFNGEKNKSEFNTILSVLNTQIKKNINLTLKDDRKYILSKYENKKYRSVIVELSHLILFNIGAKPMKVEYETMKYVDNSQIEKKCITLYQYELFLVKPHSIIKLDSKDYDFYMIEVYPRLTKSNSILENYVYDDYLIDGVTKKKSKNVS